jgi:hypothetical protein
MMGKLIERINSDVTIILMGKYKIANNGIINRYIRNVTISDVNIYGSRKGLVISGNVGDHPDENYNPNALPVVDGLTMKNVWGTNVLQPGLIRGIDGSPFTQICLSNVKLNLAAGKDAQPWNCQDVSGGALEVQPSPCTELTTTSATGFCTSAF